MGHEADSRFWHLRKERQDSESATTGATGGQVDQQLKQLMKELGDAINESLADSEQIAEVVSRIKDGGYDIFLVLEATIGVATRGERHEKRPTVPHAHS